MSRITTWRPSALAALVAIGGATSCASTGAPSAEPPKVTSAPASERAQASGPELEASPVRPPAVRVASEVRRPAGPLTFEALVSTALVESPDLQLTAARVARAEAGLAAARAAWWPTLGVDASYLRADAPSLYLFKTIDSGRFQSGTDFNSPGAFSNWEVGVGANFNLYNGGRDRLQKSIAEDARQLARLDGDALENALVAAITEGWYGVRAAEAQMRTAQASMDTVAAQLGEARARYENGSGLKTDVLSLEVRSSESEEMLIRARNGRELGLAALAQLAGLEEASSLELVGEGATTTRVSTSLEQALELAYEARPELAQARRRVEQAEREAQVADSTYLPRADMFARGWRDAPELDFDDSRDNWALGVSLTWDVFDGGRRGAGVDGARAQLDEARRSEQKARLGVQLDVRSAWLRLVDAEARLAVSAQASRTAAETLELVRAQYEGGAAPITRYLEAELMNTESQTRATSARYDLERAKADLARAVGHFRSARDND